MTIQEAEANCKVCKSTFYPDRAYLDKLILKCPHCGKPLQKKRDRKQFFVYTCVNKLCPFYVHNLTSMSTDEKADFEKNPYKYKLHYLYRVFDLDLQSLKETPQYPSPVDLARIRNPKYVLGLALTYHINYGLSFRQTSAVLFDVHNIKITKQSEMTRLLLPESSNRSWTTTPISFPIRSLSVVMKPMSKFLAKSTMSSLLWM